MTIKVAQYFDGPIRDTDQCKACDVAAGDKLEFYVCIENDEYDWETRSVHSVSKDGEEVVFCLKDGDREYQWRCQPDTYLRKVVWRRVTDQEKALAVLEALCSAVRANKYSEVTPEQFHQVSEYLFERGIL